MPRLSKKEKLRRQRISDSLKRYWKTVSKAKRRRLSKKISASLKETYRTHVRASVRRAAAKASAYAKPVPIPTGVAKPKLKPSPTPVPAPTQPLSTGLPPGFVPLNSAEQALKDMGDTFDAIKAALPNFNWSTIIHPNSDGTIDGELRLLGLPRGMSADSILFQIEAAISKTHAMWLSVGIRVPFSKPTDEIDSGGVHYRGALQTQAYPQQMKHRAENFKTARDKVVRNISRKGYRKPDELFIRLHWNPSGAPPPREK